METQPNAPIEIEKIPQLIYSVALTTLQRERLSKGHSLLIENMELPDGRIVDGKITFVEVNGEPHMKMTERRHLLELPKKVSGHTLTEEEKKSILEGKTVAIPTVPLIFLQVDKDLNRVVVSTEKDLGIPKEIGGYTLTDKDKELFANKQPLPLRVYLNPKTMSYFMATISPTENGKGLEFSNYKALDNSSAQAMIEKYNHPKNALNDISQVASEIRPSIPAGKGNETISTIEITPLRERPTRTEVKQTSTLKTTEKTENFEKHVQARNFGAIKTMTDEGFTISSRQLETLTEKYSYKPEEKIQINATVKLNNKANEKSISL